MTTVIKATDRNRGVQPVAFNFDDVADRADTYLDGIRRQAAEILAEAQAEAQRIRQKARVEGIAAGRGEVEALVDKKLAEQLGTLLPALGAAVQQIQQAKQAWLAEWEKNAVHLAAAIAAKVIRRELAHAPEIPLQLVREALELAAGGGQVRVRLNPGDYQTLAPQAKTLVRELTPLGSTEVIADEAITPGGCRVETEFGAVDQQIESQLKRIEEELA